MSDRKECPHGEWANECIDCLQIRIVELEAELTKARDNVVGTRRIFHQYLRKTKEVRLLCLQLEAELKEVRHAGKVMNRLREKAEVEATRLLLENQRLREAALLAMRCKTLPEAAQAKAALEAALKEMDDE